MRAIVCILIAAVTMSCTPKSNSPEPVKAIDPKEAFGMMKNGFAVLIDVREKHELSEGKAKVTLSAPTSAFEENSPEWQEFISHLPKNKKIILCCANAGRIGKVALALSRAGFETLDMGGFSAWKEAGLPVEP